MRWCAHMACLMLASPVGAEVLVAGNASCAGSSVSHVPAGIELSAMAVTIGAADQSFRGLKVALEEAMNAGVPVNWILIEQVQLVEDDVLLEVLELELRDILAQVGLPENAEMVRILEIAIPVGAECLLSEEDLAELLATAR